MWRIALAVLPAWVMLLPAAAEEEARPASIRIVTWNLQWYPGKRPAARPEEADAHVAEMKAAVVKMRPDVLVLQEVASAKAVEEGIAPLPDLKVAVVSGFKNSAGLVEAQQIAICSRFPATAVYSEPWNRGWAGAPRGFAFASLNCGGGDLNVYGLHLKSNLGDAQANTAKREDATMQLIAHQKWVQAELRQPRATWVICGDFNTDSVNTQVPSERTFGLLRDAGYFWSFDGVPFDQRITCPSKGRYPDACFDHVFVRGLGRPVAAPLPDVRGSDHLPVAVDVPLPLQGH